MTPTSPSPPTEANGFQISGRPLRVTMRASVRPGPAATPGVAPALVDRDPDLQGPDRSAWSSSPEGRARLGASMEQGICPPHKTLDNREFATWARSLPVRVLKGAVACLLLSRIVCDQVTGVIARALASVRRTPS